MIRYQYLRRYAQLWRCRWLLCVPFTALFYWVRSGFGRNYWRYEDGSGRQAEAFVGILRMEHGVAHCRMGWVYDFEDWAREQGYA